MRGWGPSHFRAEKHPFDKTGEVTSTYYSLFAIKARHSTKQERQYPSHTPTSPLRPRLSTNHRPCYGPGYLLQSIAGKSFIGNSAKTLIACISRKNRLLNIGLRIRHDFLPNLNWFINHSNENAYPDIFKSRINSIL